MKILFLPKYDGQLANDRFTQIIRVLKSRHEVTFLNEDENPHEPRPHFVSRLWKRVWTMRKLTKCGSKIDNVDIVYCVNIASALPGYFIAKKLKKTFVWDCEGSMQVHWKFSHRHPLRILPWIFVEKWLAKKTDFIITVTEREKEVFIKSGAKPDRVYVIPVLMVINTSGLKTKAEARETLGFSGSEKIFLFFSMFNYPPNQEALGFINKTLAPKLPGRLILCGKGNLPKKLHPKIDYRGFVPVETLRDLIRASDVCISPIWTARGTLTKVLEMLMYGAPTVITKIVHDGMPGINDGVHALVASDHDDFIKKVLFLATNETLQEKLRVNGQQLICKKYDWNLYESRFLNLVDSFGRMKK